MSTTPMFLALYNTTIRANVTRHWAKADGSARCGAPRGADSYLYETPAGTIECARCTRLGPVVPVEEHA